MRTKKSLRASRSVFAGLVVLALAACGTATPGGPELSDEPVTLRITWWGGDARHDRSQQALDLFEEKYPNITVNPEFSDWVGYWEKLATATAGGNSPDVIQMDQLYLASYAQRGALADLSDANIDTSSIEQSVMDMGIWDDNLYAVPISTAAIALMVNTDLLEQYGVELPDTTTWTWDEYADWSRAFTQASGGAVYGGSLVDTEYQVQLFIRQRGGSLFEGNDVVVDPEILEDYFQRQLDMSQTGGSLPASVWAESLNVALDQLPITTGKVATAFGTATSVAALTNASGANIELVDMPSFSDSNESWDYFKAGMYWSVASRSQHPAEAALLIDFLLNDEEAAKIIGAERGLPAHAANLALVAEELPDVDQKAVAFSQSRVPFLGPAPAIIPNGGSDIQPTLLRYLQDVVFERLTPAQASEAMIAELQAAINAAQ